MGWVLAVGADQEVVEDEPIAAAAAAAVVVGCMSALGTVAAGSLGADYTARALVLDSDLGHGPAGNSDSSGGVEVDRQLLSSLPVSSLYSFLAYPTWVYQYLRPVASAHTCLQTCPSALDLARPAGGSAAAEAAHSGRIQKSLGSVLYKALAAV